MKISIKSVRTAEAAEWDSIWLRCDYATYFHSREWAEIWNIYSEGNISPEPYLIVFSDGRKAVLPLSSSRSYKGLIRNYLSSPGGTFGGWISEDNLLEEHAVLLSEYLYNKGGTLFWRFNPYDELVGKITIPTTTQDETNAINLLGGFDAAYNSWTKGHKSATTKARREGVSVRLASSLEDWQNYYEVYEDSLKRWGDKASSRYEWKFFEEICRRNSPNVKLWLAIFQERVVAGALCFYAKRHVVYWHGAALEEHFHLRPVNLLMYEAILDACNHDYSWFDFNPSGGHEGVKAFKKSFGAIEIKTNVCINYTWTSKGLKAASFAWRLVRNK